MTFTNGECIKMKFSISFKYSNVTFKNKETKETISFDTKAQDGNSFTFDNVDEDVVIGIVKGIKNRKAADVFSYDDLRTNFINTMARNKCKELYDKIDKGEWKVEDIAISNITIKDMEFTKPTMNARETLTVESNLKMNEHTIDYPVIFKKDRHCGEVVAFFPDTVKDGSCNPGCIGCYVHHGQHGEASLGYFWDCKPCTEMEYADLLTELERIYDDVNLVVKRRLHR